MHMLTQIKFARVNAEKATKTFIQLTQAHSQSRMGCRSCFFNSRYDTSYLWLLKPRRDIGLYYHFTSARVGVPYLPHPIRHCKAHRNTRRGREGSHSFHGVGRRLRSDQLHPPPPPEVASRPSRASWQNTGHVQDSITPSIDAADGSNKLPDSVHIYRFP